MVDATNNGNGVVVDYDRSEIDCSLTADARHCLDYWNEMRGDRLAPAWREFDWLRIPPKIIPYFGVVDVATDPLDFVYRFWGSAHAQAHHQELTGKPVSAMRPRAEADSVFNQYRETLEARRPLLFSNMIRTGLMKLPVIEISLRLPFSDNGSDIHQIVAFSDIRRDLDRIEKAFINIRTTD